VTGRWPSRDPIGEIGGVNLYGLLDNDPIWTSDYLGLSNNWFQESSFECEIVFFFGHARNPSLSPEQRTPNNTVKNAVQAYQTEAKSRESGGKRALASGICCNASLASDPINKFGPKITSNIGVKDPNSYFAGLTSGPRPESPDGLVNPASPFANNQISGQSLNAIPTDFDPGYFGKLNQQDKWQAQQSIGAIRVALEIWKAYEAIACNCSCEEVLMRFVFIGENAKGKFQQRQNYINQLTAEAKAKMGVADVPWGENFEKTIPCKK
jgi:uncharacterized protein RhaS with RHS repeats